MKHWLLLLTLILSFSTPSMISAQATDDCSPDLTAVTELLAEAQTAFDDGDSETAIDLMTEANILLSLQVDDCRPAGTSDAVLIDPDTAEEYALTLDDLPDDWLEAPIAGSTDDLTFLCSELPEADAVRIRRQFLASNIGPAVINGITVFETTEAADAGFAAILDIIHDCTKWTLTAEDGTATDYRANILSEGDHGDLSITIRLQYNNVEGQLTYIQHHNTVISIGQLILEDSEPFDTELIDSLIDLILERLG
jgi:hypothetical protein